MASGLEHPSNCPGATTTITASSPSSSTAISFSQAVTLTHRFNSIRSRTHSDLGDWRSTAEQLFSEEFRVYSNSYLSLKGRDVSQQVVSDSKAGTIDLIGKTLDFESVRTVNLIVAEAGVLVQMWEAKVREEVVRGIGIIEVVKEKGSKMWQIAKWFTEFDNLSYRKGLKGGPE